MNYRIVEKVHQDPYTMARIEADVNVGGRTITIEGRGFTKRNSCDAPNAKIGYEVAETRAKEAIRQKRDKLKQVLKKTVMENKL